MDMLTAQEFQRLAEITASFCVSLLMPSHPTGRETKQDPIRFRNLIKQAEEKLVARGRRAPEAREQLDPLKQLVDDTSFWAHQDHGLAAYCTPEETRVYGVPFPLPERVTAGRRCHLLPLLPIVNENADFYVLAVSPKRVRLLEGTQHTAREIDLPGWPEDFDELAQYIEEQAQLQFHTKTAPEAPPNAERGDRRAMFHGHSGGDEKSVQRQRLLEYCRLIDQRLQKAVRSDSKPLVLACDERLASTFREASDYRRIVDEPVAGNPDTRKPAELCGEAWKILEPDVVAARESAVSRYHQAAANGLGAQGLGAVLPAAHEGRIGTLLVAGDAERWGHFDAAQPRLDIHDEPSPDDEELLNLATVEAYVHGADVYALPQEELPHRELAAAILRY